MSTGKFAPLIALACTACADPEVQAKAVAIVQHGLIQARAECSGVQSFDYDVCSLDSSPLAFTAIRLVDGSAMTDKVYSAREPEAEHLSTVVGRNGSTFKGTFSFFGDGLLTMHRDGCTSVTYDIETYCTGYNLESLGVE